MLNTFVHRQIEQGYPSFALVTSLEVTPIRKIVVTEARRRLHPIPLATLTEENQPRVVSALCDYFLNITHLNGPPPSPNTVADCLRVIKGIVSVSGLHFRTLERAVEYIYSKVVSSEMDALANTRGMHRFDAPTKDSVPPLVWQQIDLREVFSSELPTTKEDYGRCLLVFERSLLDPEATIYEDDYLQLEDNGVLQVKEREPYILILIKPRINLAYLFDYANNVRYEMNWKPDRNGYLCDGEARPFNEWMPLLLYNIGQAVYSAAYGKLSHAFERVMPWAELVRIHALKFVTKRKVISIQDVLPGALINPWTEDEEPLTVHSKLIESDFKIEMSIPPDYVQKLSKSPQQKLCDLFQLVKLLRNANDTALVHEGGLAAPFIEYVSGYYDNDKPVVGLCSMKFRVNRNVSVLQEAERIHNFAKTQGMQPGSYYAFVYCVLNDTSLPAQDELPPGTVVVGLSTMKNVLAPFGASFMLEVDELTSA